jgi:P27 family predicted phage terminase small subunit
MQTGGDQKKAQKRKMIGGYPGPPEGAKQGAQNKNGSSKLAGTHASGRRRKPTKLKLVEGRHYRLNQREPVPEGDLIVVPSHFDVRQREVWDAVLANAPSGLLKRLDAGVLACWVVALCLHEEAVQKLQLSPKIIKSPNGLPVQSPWLQILNKQAALLVRLAGELGFSPAARARVSVDEEDLEGDMTDRFFRSA